MICLILSFQLATGCERNPILIIKKGYQQTHAPN